MKLTFTVPGDPVGYYAQGQHPNWTRMKAYHGYKAHVQECAEASGIILPLVATKERQLVIKTVAYFRTGVHCDPENVRKGVTDALFYTSKKKKKKKGSGDKQTGGAFPPPLYDKANPRVEVEITSVPSAGAHVGDFQTSSTESGKEQSTDRTQTDVDKLVETCRRR